MPRRYLVGVLALVVALVAITPTLGAAGTQSLIDKSSFPVRTAKKAKQIAKQAKKVANQALTAAQVAQATAETAQNLANDAQAAAAQAKQSADAAQASATQAKTSADQAQTSANNAQSSANNAQTSANTAQTSANNAQSSADAVAAELAGLRAKSDTDAATVTTAEETTFVDLGGPSVEVTVPPSGLIEVVVQAEMDDDAALALFEDGVQVPGQDPNDFCQTVGGGLSPLLANDSGGAGPLVLSTGSITFVCGSISAPVPVLFETTPGAHTYELRYADCGCTATDAEVSDRMLTVAPRP